MCQRILISTKKDLYLYLFLAIFCTTPILAGSLSLWLVHLIMKLDTVIWRSVLAASQIKTRSIR